MRINLGSDVHFLCGVAISLVVVGYSHVGWGLWPIVAGGESQSCAFGDSACLRLGIFSYPEPTAHCGCILSCAYDVP